MSEQKIFLPDIVGKGYKEYWDCKKRYRILKGGKGSKKSSTTALNIIYRMMKYKEANTLVVRQVMDTHRNSTFAQLQWAIGKLKVDNEWKCTVSPMEITYLPTGQKILFRGFDDVLKLASTTVTRGYLCWVWIEEAFEIASEDDFDKLDLSVPRGAVPAPLFKQTTITFNPWSEMHWLKSRFFDRKSVSVESFTTNYLVNEFLDATDKEIFETMKKINPRKYAVAGLGDWGITDGLVFENWVVRDFNRQTFEFDNISENDKISFDISSAKHIFGLDYGYTNDPCAFIVGVVDTKSKVILIYDEHYQIRMLNCDIAKMIRDKGYAKERIYADSAEPKSNDDLRRLGISRIRGATKGKDSILNGIAAIQEFKIVVHPTCKNTISELSSYCWDKDKFGRSLNKPIDTNNHLMDALRYAFCDVRFAGDDFGVKKVRNEFLVSEEDFNGGWC